MYDSNTRDLYLILLSSKHWILACEARLLGHPRALVYELVSFLRKRPHCLLPCHPSYFSLTSKVPLWFPSPALLLTAENVDSAAVNPKVIKYDKFPLGWTLWVLISTPLPVLSWKKGTFKKTLQTSKSSGLYSYPKCLHLHDYSSEMGTSRRCFEVKLNKWYVTVKIHILNYYCLIRSITLQPQLDNWRWNISNYFHGVPLGSWCRILVFIDIHHP